MALIKYRDMILSPEEYRDVLRYEKLEDMENKKKLWAIAGFILAVAIGYSISYFLGTSYYITIPISIILGRVINGVFRLLAKVVVVLAIIAFFIYMFVNQE